MQGMQSLTVQARVAHLAMLECFKASQAGYRSLFVLLSICFGWLCFCFRRTAELAKNLGGSRTGDLVQDVSSRRLAFYAAIEVLGLPMELPACLLQCSQHTHVDYQ
jgi:hypothetical protein